MHTFSDETAIYMHTSHRMIQRVYLPQRKNPNLSQCTVFSNTAKTVNSSSSSYALIYNNNMNIKIATIYDRNRIVNIPSIYNKIQRGISSNIEDHKPKPEREWNIWSYRRQKDYYEPKDYYYNQKNKKGGMLFYDSQSPPNSTVQDDGINVWVGKPSLDIPAIQSLRLVEKTRISKKKQNTQRDDVYMYSRHINHYAKPKYEEKVLKPPAYINYSAKDTYTMYSHRIRKCTLKIQRKYCSAITDIRNKLLQANADEKIRKILDRKRLQRDYKNIKKLKNKEEQQKFMIRRGNELLQRKQRMNEKERQKEIELLSRKLRYLENILQEKQASWILDSNDIKEEHFTISQPTDVPTGWWGSVEPSTVTHSEFEFDNNDRDKYFTTERMRFATHPEIYKKRSIDRLTSNEVVPTEVENIIY